MKVFRVVLKPKSSLQKIPASDTLFGALCWGIKEIYGEDKLTYLINHFDKDKSGFFIISSVLPLLSDNKEEIPFYPMPYLPEPDSDKLSGLADKYKDKFRGCLLYTSPSPRDLSTSRMPSSA